MDLSRSNFEQALIRHSGAAAGGARNPAGLAKALDPRLRGDDENKLHGDDERNKLRGDDAILLRHSGFRRDDGP